MSNLSVFKYTKHCRGIKEKFLAIFKNIKYIYQRAIKGYCDGDLWDLSFFFSELIPVCLEQFSKVTHSHPYDTTYEEWQEYLLKIARLIRESAEDSPEIDKKIEEISNESDTSRNSAIFKKNYEELLKEAEKETKIKNQKRQMAFKMLAEKFGDLWD